MFVVIMGTCSTTTNVTKKSWDACSMRMMFACSVGMGFSYTMVCVMLASARIICRRTPTTQRMGTNH